MSNDHIKMALAAMVRNSIMSIGKIDDLPANANIVSDLQTRVRVLTPNGPRYFTVQVKEDY